MHRLVILGSLVENLRLIQRARERGYYTIVCDGYADGPGKALADKAYTIDVRDEKALAAMCRAEGADGIMGTFSDLLFEQITKVAALTGLRWYAAPEMLPLYREKDKAKALLASLGVSVPQNRVLERDFRHEELEGLRFPLVIKPINGWGSKGIFVVRSEEEIRELFPQVVGRATKGGILAEEYSPGREYNMTCWMADGVIYPLSIADREKNPQEGMALPLLNRIVYPARKTAELLPQAMDVLYRFARATGQREGALSMQFFYNASGVEVCEIAGRMLGYEHEMITITSGFDVEDMLLDYVYEPATLAARLKAHSPLLPGCCAGVYFCGRQGSVIASQETAKSLAADPHVVLSRFFYRDGETVDNYGPNPYLCMYYLAGAARAEVDAVSERFFKTISVAGPTGEDILLPAVLERD